MIYSLLLDLNGNETTVFDPYEKDKDFFEATPYVKDD